jgi:nitrite reductase/ring-hydroxylating ferredoxin subunit
VAAPLPVGRYERTVSASLPRVWENVYDWEHLPWLHRSTFASVALVDSGEWGWRARVGLQPAAAGREVELELRREGSDAYRVRTLAGEGEGTEIHTRLAGRGPRATGVEVEFLVPGVAPEQAAGLGRAYAALYARLWDEDEAMMVRRQARLDAPASRATRAPVPLGRRAELSLPCVVEAGGRSWRVLELDGELLAHAAVCPHRLGPLEEACVEDGAIRCPWHGYRFDVRSGRGLDGRRLRLPSAPRVEVGRDGAVALVFAAGGEGVAEGPG